MNSSEIVRLLSDRGADGIYTATYGNSTVSCDGNPACVSLIEREQRELNAQLIIPTFRVGVSVEVLTDDRGLVDWNAVVFEFKAWCVLFCFPATATGYGVLYYVKKRGGVMFSELSEKSDVHLVRVIRRDEVFLYASHECLVSAEQMPRPAPWREWSRLTCRYFGGRVASTAADGMCAMFEASLGRKHCHSVEID